MRKVLLVLLLLTNLKASLAQSVSSTSSPQDWIAQVHEHCFNPYRYDWDGNPKRETVLCYANYLRGLAKLRSVHFGIHFTLEVCGIKSASYAQTDYKETMPYPDLICFARYARETQQMTGSLHSTLKALVETPIRSSDEKAALSFLLSSYPNIFRYSKQAGNFWLNGPMVVEAYYIGERPSRCSSRGYSEIFQCLLDGYP